MDTAAGYTILLAAKARPRCNDDVTRSRNLKTAIVFPLSALASYSVSAGLPSHLPTRLIALYPVISGRFRERNNASQRIISGHHMSCEGPASWHWDPPLHEVIY